MYISFLPSYLSFSHPSESYPPSLPLSSLCFFFSPPLLNFPSIKPRPLYFFTSILLLLFESFTPSLPVFLPSSFSLFLPTVPPLLFLSSIHLLHLFFHSVHHSHSLHLSSYQSSAPSVSSFLPPVSSFSFLHALSFLFLCSFLHSLQLSLKSLFFLLCPLKPSFSSPSLFFSSLLLLVESPPAFLFHHLPSSYPFSLLFIFL